MFRFEHPAFLWVFALVPIAVILFLASRWLGSRAGERFAVPVAMNRLLSDLSGTRIWLKAVFLFLSIALLCMSLANPQWGVRRESVQAKAADVFIAMDISTSMYARDIAPSRMERAKKFAIDLVNKLRGDRIGIILFAGSAYLQMPLTTDYAAAELFIKSAHPGLASTQGTAIGEAVDLAMRAYVEDSGNHHALVVITDGENHEEGAIDEMKRASDSGLIPFLVSVGTEEGGFIPVVIQGREDYKRDENGSPVRSAVNTEFLRELANAGNGHVYDVQDAGFVVNDIREKIDMFEKREMEQRAFKDFNSYYQYFLAGALFLLIVVGTLGDRRRLSVNEATV